MKLALISLPIILLIIIVTFLIIPIKAQTSYCAGGDLDCNGKLEVNDLKILLSLYGSNTKEADLNNSGKVTAQDAAILVAKIFSQSGPPLTNTPPFPLYNAAKERVPDFCTTGLVPGGGSIAATTKSGNWSDPSVWSNNQVPNNLANGVQILSGHTITYDETAGISISCIKILEGAALKFRTDIDTKLTVGTITDFGYLEVGTEINPVQSGKKAEIVIADQPLMIDTTTPTNSKDPNQFGTSILVLKNGVMKIHGEVKDQDPNIYNTNSHAFIRLTAEPKAGQTTLQLSEDVTKYNWHVNDKIILPDSRQAPLDNQAMRLGHYPTFNEKLTIGSISSDGKTLTLTTPLLSDHPGARDADGTMRFLPHVGNMTRNVYIHSPLGAVTRAQTLFSERADIDIRYAQFDDMGRTQAAVPLNSVAYDASNNVTKIGTNQIGRYTIHFHHDEGPVRTSAQQTDSRVFQGILVGNAIDEGGGSKWGITIHDTSFTLVKNNVVANSRGANIMLEDGNEYKNVIEGNFLVGSFGPQIQQANGFLGDSENRCTNGVVDTGWEGTGIWSRSAFSYIRNNVAAANKDSGFLYYPFWDDANCPFKTNQMVPSKNYVINNNYSNPSDPSVGLGSGTDNRGADMYDMTQVTDLGKAGSQRIIQFYNNESYGSTEKGAMVWAGGWNSTVDTFRTWNTNVSGVTFMYTAQFESAGIPHAVKNSIFRGDISGLKSSVDNASFDAGVGGGGNVGIEQNGGQYANYTLDQNNDIQGYKMGIQSSCIDFRVDNNKLINYVNIWIDEAQCRFTRRAYITNNAMNPIPNLILNIKTPFDIYAVPNFAVVVQGGDSEFSAHWNLVTHPDIIKITGNTSKGQPIPDSRLYFLEQDPGFDIKQADPTTKRNIPPWDQWPSLTNQLSWIQYGNAIADAVTPCATQLSNIRGFVCPLTMPETDETKNAQVQVDVYGNNKIDSTTGLGNVIFHVNPSDYAGYGINKPITLSPGVSFVTVTDQDIPQANQFQVLDLNKNNQIDPPERFKKSLIVCFKSAGCP